MKDHNVLMSFWINRKIKHEFTTACKVNNTNMTTEINRFIREYIENNRELVDQRTDFFGDIIRVPSDHDFDNDW